MTTGASINQARYEYTPTAVSVEVSSNEATTQLARDTVSIKHAEKGQTLPATNSDLLTSTLIQQANDPAIRQYVARNNQEIRMDATEIRSSDGKWSNTAK